MPRPILASALVCVVIVVAGGFGSVAPGNATEPPATAAADAGELSRQREAAFQEFRGHFEAARYNEALPAAERVVALTEKLDPQHLELPSALNNLGATQYRLGDFIAAENAYGRALRIIEEHNGASSRRLITPLIGLGLTYQAGGRNDAATPLLERAVAISRHADGLFNPEQREALLPLIDSYMALARWREIEREEQYALKISEQQYGLTDLRLLPSLQRLAHWYELGHRTNEARRIWQRMLTIASDRAHQSAVWVVAALRGFAYTFRLDYQYGPDLTQEQSALGPTLGGSSDSVQRDAFGRRTAPQTTPEFRLDSQGKTALEAGLAMLEKIKPPPQLAISAVLLDLGDWQQVGGHSDKALALYRRALPALPAESGTAEAQINPLAHPVQLLYRSPPSARRYMELPASEVTEKSAFAEFSVTADGKVKDVSILEGDANDAQKAAFATALSRSLWRPRFVDGQPVATEKVRYRETFRQPKH